MQTPKWPPNLHFSWLDKGYPEVAVDSEGNGMAWRSQGVQINSADCQYYNILYNHQPFRGVVGCKHGGRSKNVNNNFDPFVFFPDGEGYMYVRPPTSKTEPRKIYIRRGGRKSVIDTLPRTPPFPPPYSTDRGGR